MAAHARPARSTVTPIPAAESDGLIASGFKQARTFGEAQLDLRLLFQPNKCASFGSAMLKSRSSDAFNSQLKDFVAPVPINLQNCGQVIIRKQTIPDEDPNTTNFGYTKNFTTDPVSVNTFTLQDDGVKDYGKTVLVRQRLHRDRRRHPGQLGLRQPRLQSPAPERVDAVIDQRQLR